jgi:large subunit ribosomal protein L25
LTIEKRDASGKSPTARRVRNAGRVPGVMYHADGNIPFSADNLELAAVLRKGATLIDANVDGTEHLTVVKEYQVHPVRGSLVHIDLQAVKMDQSVRTTAQLVLTGTSPGIKEGGILTQGAREVYIECLASAIPDQIEYDISNVLAGETRILKDVEPPEGVRFLDDEGTMVIAINMPRGAKQKKNAEGESVDMTLEEEAASDAAEAAGN